MTLQELTGKISGTFGKAMPTPSRLKAGTSPVVAYLEAKDGSRLTVYENGFALYEAEGSETVFRVDYCGGYAYFGRRGVDYLTEEFFQDAEWWVRLVLEGEDRLTHNRNVKVEDNECPYDGAIGVSDTAPGIVESPEESYLRREAFSLLMSLLTKRQKEVVLLYYVGGMTLMEIAAVYGVSHQAIHTTLSDVKKKIAKNLNLFE